MVRGLKGLAAADRENAKFAMAGAWAADDLARANVLSGAAAVNPRAQAVRLERFGAQVGRLECCVLQGEGGLCWGLPACSPRLLRLCRARQVPRQPWLAPAVPVASPCPAPGPTPSLT